MNDEKINEILNDISKSSNYEVKFEEDFPTWDEFQQYLTLINLLQNDLKIIFKPFENRRILSLSREGTKIIERGGWINHLKLEDEKNKQNTERDKLDFLGKKWIYKTRLLPYILSIIALIFSGITLYTNSQKKVEIDELKKEINKLKVEIKNLKK